MKKLFISILMILSLFSTSLYAQVGVISEGETTFNEQLQSFVNIAKSKINNAVSITGISNQGMYTCSGVVIKNTPTQSIVLTAKHCVGLVEELYVESILASSTGSSIYDDIAYIKTDKQIPDKKAVVISEFSPKKDDFVIIVGYPSMKLFISIGNLKNTTKDWQFASIDVKPGVSGSGVYNEYGELISIVWGGLGKPDEKLDGLMNTGIFERYEDMINFIKDNKLLD